MPKTRDTPPPESDPPADSARCLAGASSAGDDLVAWAREGDPPAAERLALVLAALRARLAKGRFKPLDRHLRGAEGYLTAQLRNPDGLSVVDAFAVARWLGLAPAEVLELAFRPHPVPPPHPELLLRLHSRSMRGKGPWCERVSALVEWLAELEAAEAGAPAESRLARVPVDDFHALLDLRPEEEPHAALQVLEAVRRRWPVSLPRAVFEPLAVACLRLSRLLETPPAGRPELSARELAGARHTGLDLLNAVAGLDLLEDLRLVRGELYLRSAELLAELGHSVHGARLLARAESLALLRVDLDLLARVLDARAALAEDPALAGLFRRSARAFRGEAVEPAPPVAWAEPGESREVERLFQALGSLRSGFSVARRRRFDVEVLGGPEGKAFHEFRRHPARTKLGLGRLARIAEFSGSDLPELLSTIASPAELPSPPPRGCLWAHREEKQPQPPAAAFEIQAWAEALPRREEGLAPRLGEEALSLGQIHELARERPAALAPRDLFWLGRSLGLLGYHARQKGRRNESALYLDTALAVAGEAADFGLLSFAYRHGSILLRDFGYLRMADLLSGRAAYGAVAAGSERDLIRCLHQRAWLNRHQGRSKVATAIFQALAERLPSGEAELRLALMQTLTLLALERKDLVEAGRLIEDAEAFAEPSDLYFDVRRLDFKARFLSVSGQFEEAQACFQAALEKAASSFLPTEIASLGLVYLEHLLRHGRQAAALEHVNRLLPLAEQFSANPEGERALLELQTHSLATGAITASALAKTRVAIEEPWRFRGPNAQSQ